MPLKDRINFVTIPLQLYLIMFKNHETWNKYNMRNGEQKEIQAGRCKATDKARIDGL